MPAEVRWVAVSWLASWWAWSIGWMVCASICGGASLSCGGRNI